MMILLKAILDTVGASEFNKIAATGSLEIGGAALAAGLLKVDMVTPGGANPTLRDWVPGDRGYIRGVGGRGLMAGEWVIFKGGDQFWGFDETIHETDLKGMIDAVLGFYGVTGASETGQRWYPGVGLQK